MGGRGPASDFQRRQLVGGKSEDYAASYLEIRGMQCIARNCFISGSELDLVMKMESPGNSHATIVFVEVRSRSTWRYGKASETIGADKRRFLVRGATAWLIRERLWGKVACRFDVVALLWPREAHAPTKVEWLRNAFEAEEPTHYRRR